MVGIVLNSKIVKIYRLQTFLKICLLYLEFVADILLAETVLSLDLSLRAGGTGCCLSRLTDR